MKPRRLHSATILSMVTTSLTIAGVMLVGVRRQEPRRRLAGEVVHRLSSDAHLRVPVRERTPLRGDAEDRRSAGDVVRDLRGAGRAGLPPDRGALQGLGVLQHRLRDVQAQARAGRVRQGGRRHARREEQGEEGVRLRLEGHLRSGRERRLVPGAVGGSGLNRRRAAAAAYRPALQPRRNRSTSACLVASSTVSPAPPFGSVTRPDGLSTRCFPPPPVSEAPTTPSSVGPAMSERTALGAAHETHGSRMNVSNDVTLSFIAETSCCWRLARARSSSLGLQRFLRVRASASAWRPLISVSPRLRRSVVPPLRRPPLILERTQPPL